MGGEEGLFPSKRRGEGGPREVDPVGAVPKIPLEKGGGEGP